MRKAIITALPSLSEATPPRRAGRSTYAVLERIGVLHLLLLCTSCATSYFVDPVSTPLFDSQGQVELSTAIASHNKIIFEGAYALPYNLLINASRQSWGHALDNDQEMTSVGVGRFWPSSDSSINLLVLGGVGSGSHRVGPDYSFDFQGPPLRAASAQNIQIVTENTTQLLTAHSDFRKYFAQFDYAYLPTKVSSVGAAARFEFLDQYRFEQIKTIRHSNSPDKDTTYIYDNEPKHTLSLDLAVFGGVGISIFQLYAQVLTAMPLWGIYGHWDWDLFVFSGGLKIKF